jgi:hypothetical protein
MRLTGRRASPPCLAGRSTSPTPGSSTDGCRRRRQTGPRPRPPSVSHPARRRSVGGRRRVARCHPGPGPTHRRKGRAVVGRLGASVAPLSRRVRRRPTRRFRPPPTGLDGAGQPFDPSRRPRSLVIDDVDRSVGRPPAGVGDPDPESVGLAVSGVRPEARAQIGEPGGDGPSRDRRRRIGARRTGARSRRTPPV